MKINNSLNKPKINIVIFFDSKMLFQFKTLYNSIMDNYARNEVSFLIGTNKKTIEKVGEIIEEGISSKVIDIAEYLEKEYSDYKPMFEEEHSQINIFSMAILDICKLFDIEINESIIYVDIDTIFQSRINDKYMNTNDNFGFPHPNLEKFEENYAACEKLKELLSQNEYLNFIKNCRENNIINTGVLILNDIKKYDDLIEKMDKKNGLIADGYLINAYNTGEIKCSLDPSHNFLINIYEDDDLLIEEAVIIHFAEKPKPWDSAKRDLEKLKKTKYFKYYV